MRRDVDREDPGRFDRSSRDRLHSKSVAPIGRHPRRGYRVSSEIEKLLTVDMLKIGERTAMGVLGNRADAEDAAGEAAIRFVRAVRKRMHDNPDALMRTCASRAAIQMLREKRGEVTLGILEQEDLVAADFGFAPDTVLDLMVIEEVLATFPPLARDCLVLKASGRKDADSAKIVGLHLSAFKTVVSRWRARLKEKVKGTIG